MDKQFKAWMVEKKADEVIGSVRTLTMADLPTADVLIKVAYSSVNYKDGLASTAEGKIVQSYPFIPGIDLAGVVVSSQDARFEEGDEVIATSYEIGVSHFGGYSEYAQLPGDWVVPLPANLTLKEAMIIGTAGFTAALSVHRLEENGLMPGNGEVLVTGASGGVGSLAVAMLAKRGYEVIASSGKSEEHDFLKKIGASEVISREDVYNGKIRAMDKQLWQGAIDPVGGESLAAVLSKIQYGGSVAVSGLTGGTNVPTTVFPFILRAVNLLGIDSVNCPMTTRRVLWERLAEDLKPDNLQQFVDRETTLSNLHEDLAKILESKVRGRVLVEL